MNANAVSRVAVVADSPPSFRSKRDATPLCRAERGNVALRRRGESKSWA